MIRVLLVDDDPLVRSALRLMLGGQQEIEVVGEAVDGQDALDRAAELSPDVVLMDIRMPRMDGLEATRALLARGGGTAPRVVVLTTFDADEYVVEALAAGADGFLLKDTPPAEIVAAVRKVVDGDPMLSPSVTRTLISRLRDGSGDGAGDGAGDDAAARAAAAAREAAARLSTLTEREMDVALAVGRGLSNAEVAGELYLSVPTVKTHVSRVFDKLGVTNRVQVAICVHDAGLD
ncbi:response regulator transcription factor [Nocardioides litoris]|uniref:response regulator transcription factor n=1 Tax=Nocardioides litoris TaxID=1926648 RepID=UPI001B86C057|nr:response regulator transcription factor [Nocardioides litoris]